MNNTVSLITGLTPHYSFHQFEPVDALDYGLGSTEHLSSNTVTFAEELRAQSVRRHELLQKCKEKGSLNMKQAHDREILALPDFKQGDLVLMDTHNHPKSSKQMRKFKSAAQRSVSHSQY